MLMVYCRRASPKQRYNIIEVDYGGEGHRTRLKDPRDKLINLCVSRVPPPPPPYIKEQGGRPAGPCGRAKEEESSS